MMTIFLISILILLIFGILYFVDNFDEDPVLSTFARKCLLLGIILSLCYIVTVLSINYLFITKDIKVYNDVFVKYFISNTKREYFYIKTKNKDFLLSNGDIEVIMSDTNQLEVEVKIPKIKVLNLDEGLRTNYILKIK